MRRLSSLITTLLFTTFASASGAGRHIPVHPVDTLLEQTSRVAQRYSQRIDSLIQVRNQTGKQGKRVNTTMNPYYFRLLLPATLYDQPIRRRMGVQWSPSLADSCADLSLMLFPSLLHDPVLSRSAAADEALSSIYVTHPEYVQRTQQEMSQQGTLRQDIEQPIESEARMADQAVTIDITPEDVEPVKFVTRRPNFWKISGSGSLRFTQSYFSDNWFQGGEKNYSGLAEVTLNVNYNNQRKVNWTNKLELQLGFQTAKSDTCHTFRATSNLIRFTTNFGYKASKYWDYSGSVQLQSQLYPNYQTNSRKVTADFLSPLDVTVAIGMDYKFSKPRFSGTLKLAPLAYNMRYVDRPSLATRYGVAEGHRSKHTFGPNVKLEYNWTVVKNVTWGSRLYWFSNFSYTNIEWENTFTFTVNKYLNTKLFVYPKFDDSSRAYKGKHGYFMMKEWLSLGLSYSW